MICGNCKTHALSVKSVRACYESKLGVGGCGWLVSLGFDDCGGEIIRECGAHLTMSDRGWSCEGGHEHVYAEVRWSEGWDYCADEGEAILLRRAGVDAVAMNGGPI